MTAGVVPARTSAYLCGRIRAGDGQAFTELIRRNQRAVEFLLVEFDWATMYLPREDQLQEALIGFWKAAVDYEPRRDATYSTMAKTYARNELRNAVAKARSIKAMMIRDAMSLDAPVTDSDGQTIGTLSDTLAGPEWLDPEVIAAIRDELHILSTQLPQQLSQVEHEALTRVMLDERTGPRPAALGRVQQKASRLLGYWWRRGERLTSEQRKAKVFELIDAGHTQRHAAKVAGVPHGNVGRWVAQRKQGQLESKREGAAA